MVSVFRCHPQGNEPWLTTSETEVNLSGLVPDGHYCHVYFNSLAHPLASAGAEVVVLVSNAPHAHRFGLSRVYIVQVERVCLLMLFSFLVGFVALVQSSLDHTDCPSPQERSLPSTVAAFAPKDIHFECDALI